MREEEVVEEVEEEAVEEVEEVVVGGVFRFFLFRLVFVYRMLNFCEEKVHFGFLFLESVIVTENQATCE